MSFSDMMSSGRGPGVIGMLMALVVLLGFGLLFMFAFDEGLQGADQSIESVIRDQEKDISDYKDRIEKGQKSLAQAPVRIAASKDLARFKAESSSLKQKISALAESVETGKSGLATAKEEFEGYKNQYRAFVRGKAKGTSLDVLQLSDGTTYDRVYIRTVDAVGILIRHEAGQKRIDYEGLPAEMKDYYQFDPGQKKELLDQEARNHGALLDAVDKKNKEDEIAATTRRDDEVAVEKENADEQIKVKTERIRQLKQKLEDLDKDLEREKKKKLANTDAIKSNISATQRLISTLQADILKLKSKL